MAHLSFHLDRLFKEWKTDPHRALEFLLALKEPFECLPLKEFQEFFLRFISVCPSYDPQIEGFMLSALEKIRSEDEKEAIAVLKVMHDKGITKQYSALDICYRSLIKPEVVKVEKDKPPEEKKEKEAESAASTPKPVEKPVSEQVKENERLLALIKSDKDIESVEDLFFRLFYFSRVNLKDEKSLRFLLRYIPRFLAKIDKFTDGTFALECEQFKILYDVIEKERERIDGLKDELLAGSSSHLYKEYRSCFYCFELTIRRFDLRQKASSYQFPTQIFEDHVKGIKDGILTDEAFLRCWKDLVPLIFTRDKWDHLLNHVMDQEYYDNGIKEEVVCVVQQILIDNLISRMEKTVNAAYLDNAAAEIRALAGSEYLPKSREGTVNIFTAYNSAWKVFRIIIKWFDHEKDDENFWNILEHHATNLIEILNGTHDKEKCALWRAGLSATESDQLGADLANVLKAISKIKKSLDEDEMANEKEKTEQVSKLHGEAWGLWQDYVKEKEASKKASLEPLKKAFSLCSQAFQIKQDQKNVVQLFFIIARELQNWHQLLPFLEKFDEAFPKDADILFDIAKAYEELKEYPKAIAYYSRAFVADPNSKEVQLELAYCLAQNGEKQKAVQFLDRFLKKWPDDLKAHFNRAGYLIDLGQHEKALEDFRAVIDIKAEGEGERRMQGRARMVLEQYGVKKTSHKATDAQKKLKALLQKKKSNRKG